MAWYKGCQHKISTLPPKHALGTVFGGLWDRMQQLTDSSAELQQRLSEVQHSVAQSSAASTKKVYSGWFRHFADFCHKHKVKLKNVTPAEVTFFLQEQLNEGKAASSVNQAVSAMAWHYKTADAADPTKNAVVAAMVANAKHSAPPVKHKQPAKREHMVRLYNYAQEMQTCIARRTLALALSCFASMSRTDDLIDITRDTPFFRDTFVRFDLPRMKTAAYAEGDEKFMAKVEGSPMCPCKILADWMERDDVGKGDKDPLFPAHHDLSKSISMTTYSENIQAALQGCNLPRITPHSFRSGAATRGASNNMSMHDLQLSGSWKDPRSVLAYIKWNPERRVKAAHSYSL